MVAHNDPTAGELPRTVAELRRTVAAQYNALIAVLAALDIPPAADAVNDRMRTWILHERTVHALAFLRGVDDDDVRALEWGTEFLRKRLAETPPVGYVTDDQAHAAVAAGKTWDEATALPDPDDQAPEVEHAAPWTAEADRDTLDPGCDVLLYTHAPTRFLHVIVSDTATSAEIDAALPPLIDRIRRNSGPVAADAAQAALDKLLAPPVPFEVLPEHMPTSLAELLDRVPGGQPRVIIGADFPGDDIKAVVTHLDGKPAIVLPVGPLLDHHPAIRHAVDALIRRGPVPADDACVIEEVDA